MSNEQGRQASEVSATSIRIGVIGAAGQLGRCLVREIERASDLRLGFATTREDLDLACSETLPKAVARRLDAASQVEVVVNAAAHTGVDACESEAALAYQVNALAPAEWARGTVARGMRFLHVSTDYVFDGRGQRAYSEDDPSAPQTVYGASKRAGEVAVLGTDPAALVVRTSWVFGPGRNFVVAILEQAMKRRRGEQSGPLRVVDDQHGSPTSASDLAEALLVLARRAAGRPAAGRTGVSGGLLHLCNAGQTTWFGFAREILDRAGFGDLEIEPVPTSAFPTPARRPAWSVLDTTRAADLGIEMPQWTDALSRYLAGPDRPAVLATASAEPASPIEEVSR